ncbi:hypothetical protein Mal52_53920 [Symmachiella dynata]|uniref:Uncharacterized protein n=1 Tax=Symmachiella dynata TaxID=2527995 RepID=A0A517ZWK2_9PLAN|nr:hypothetical protein Mal52_53920 [Symmachiella dynata]
MIGFVGCGRLCWVPTMALSPRQVAQQLMSYDAWGAHARDELSISETMSAGPVQFSWQPTIKNTITADKLVVADTAA